MTNTIEVLTKYANKEECNERKEGFVRTGRFSNNSSF